MSPPRDFKHCPLCAAGLAPATVEGRERMRCSGCGYVVFLNPACAAAGVIFNPQGEVLLVRRAIEPWKGAWALPAGYQEIDEGPEHALVREVYEEAGVKVEVLGLLDLIHVDTDPRKPANVAVYLGRAAEVEPVADGADVSEVGWFALSALPEPIGFDNYPRILARLSDPKRYPRSAWTHLEALLGGES